MRLEIVYDGQQYSLAKRDSASVRAEVEEALRSGSSFWLEVQRGEGEYTPTHLLIAPGIAFAITETLTGGTSPLAED